MRSTDTMDLSEEKVLQTLMQARGRISAAAWVVVRDAHAAEDIFQNVALKALTKDVEFPAEGALISWAFVSARREAIDWIRRHRRETTGLHEDVLDLLHEDWVQEPVRRGNARVDALRDCLEGLPERSRLILRLRYVEGYSCSEVGDKMGAALTAVYKRLSRLHRGLKQCIEHRLDGLEVRGT